MRLPLFKFALPLIALLPCASALTAHPQSRVEAGVFLEYLGISQTNTDNVGLGARFGCRVHRHVTLEGELAYDYGVNFNEVYRDITTRNIKAIERTSVGVTDGFFGPTLQPAHGHLHPFVTMKAGFVDFRLSPGLIPYSGIVSSILGIRTSALSGALYPGAGIEPALGPLGLRVEFGDAIYFNGGAHNNFRLTFGPVLRF